MATQPPPYAPPGAPFGFDPRQQRRYIRDQERARSAAFRAQRQLLRQQARAMRRSSILGPLLVVAVGIVVLLIQTEYLPFGVFASWYGRWWPGLLVSAGIVLVLEWAFDEKVRHASGTHVHRSMGFGLTFLLLLVALSGAAFGGLRNGNELWIQGFSINPDKLHELFGQKHELEQVIDQAFVPGTTLMVSNPRGDVTVTGKSDDGRIHVTVNKQVYGISDADAEARGESLNPELSFSGSVLNMRVPALEGCTSDLVISLPEGGPVVINADRGSVRVSAMDAEVTVTANHGDVELRSITNSVRARMNHNGSSFSAREVKGAVSLTGHAQDVNIADISGAVSLNGDFYGETRLERLKGALTFQTSRTFFALTRLDGTVHIDRSELSGDQMVGPTTLRVRSRNVSLQRVSGNLAVEDSNGTIDVSSAPPLGDISIEDSNGAVNLTLPQNAGISVNAQTQGGDVGDDLSLTRSNANGLSTLRGVRGDGQAKIRVQTTHADINIHKATLPRLLPPPEAPAPPEEDTHDPNFHS